MPEFGWMAVFFMILCVSKCGGTGVKMRINILIIMLTTHVFEATDITYTVVLIAANGSQQSHYLEGYDIMSMTP